MLQDVFSFLYFIIIEDSESFSPFCGFGENLLTARNEVLKVFTLPKNILELGRNKENKFKKRLHLNTAHCIFPIKYHSFCSTDFKFSFLLPILIYDKSRFPEIPSAIKKLQNPPLLIEIHKQISDRDYINFFYERINCFQKRHSNDIPYEIVENLKKEPESDVNSEFIYKKIMLHGTISFLIKVLEDNGFSFVKKVAFSPTINQDAYYKNIWNTNIFIKQFIEKKKKSCNLVDCIFTSAPLYTRYLLKTSFEKIDNIKLRKNFKKVIAQTGYIHDCDDIEVMVPALLLRQEEINFYYLCLYLIFEKYFCPVIRLPQGVQTDVQGEIDALLNSKNDKKLQAFLNLVKKEEKYFKEYVFFVNTFKKIPTVKIYSDGPVEFVRDKKNNLPIIISTSLCKIPTTPGNVFFNSVANDMELFIQYNELFEILIIRSFKDNDVNKYTLEKSIYHFFVDIGIQHIHYVIKDVSTCESLVDVLRKYSNVKIVIFDCHGHQTKKDVFGGLVIGNELFNIWEYVQKSEYFPVPPIVMFSACNTYPLGNTFNSIANGFLAAGVKSVIATNSPVDSLDSGIFIARILYRLDELLPKFFEIKKTITWLDFISDFFRMSYITDITRILYDKGLLKEIDLNQIRMSENFLINSKNLEWYQEFLHSLVKRMGKNKKEIKNIINSTIGFTETMKYIILGNADSIIIHGN